MKKLFLSIIGLICFSNLFAIGPIIIPMPIHSGGGSGDPNAMFALYLAANVICITIIMILSAIWLIRKSNNCDFDTSYWEYCFDVSLNGNSALSGLNSVIFVCINALAFLFLLADLFLKNL